MSKHTKGPWKVADNRVVRTIDETHKKGGLIIADVYGHCADNTKANAQLIAVAPELLKACKAAVYILKRKAPWAKEIRDQPWYARARAAVAKATKEQC